LTVDVIEWQEIYFVMGKGYPWNPFSPYHDDMLQLWLNVEAIRLVDDISRVAEYLLELAPLQDQCVMLIGNRMFLGVCNLFRDELGCFLVCNVNICLADLTIDDVMMGEV